MEEKISVFLASDDKYAPFVATSMASILENTNSFIDFYILDSGITERTKQKIDFSNNRFKNYSIEYIKIDAQESFKNLPDKCHFTKSMYNRYLIPSLKPDLKKAIYADVDEIFIGDIKEFYDIDMEGFGLAAGCFEHPIKGSDYEVAFANRKKRYNIAPTHKYFQSGNLLIDCGYWRKNNIEKKLFEVTEKYNELLVCPDLEALNIVFDSNYKKLDYRYTMCTHLVGRNEKSEEVLSAEAKPFLIHYSGSGKPWNDKNIYLSEHFWYYARNTAFYEDLLYEKFKFKLLDEGFIKRKKKTIFSKLSFKGLSK